MIRYWCCARSFLAKRSFAICHLVSLIVTLTSKDIAIRNTTGDFEAPKSLSPESIADLNWWIISLPSAYLLIMEYRMLPLSQVVAPLSRGWGAACETACTHNLWSEAEATYHITCWICWEGNLVSLRSRLLTVRTNSYGLSQTT